MKRGAGYGTGNGGAVFTCDRTAGQADPSPLVLTWTGGQRTTFAYCIGVYIDAAFLGSGAVSHATVDATAPVFPSLPVQAGGQHVVAATNNVGLYADPPSGYVERVDVNGTAVAKYGNVSSAALTSKASGALTVVPPAGDWAKRTFVLSITPTRRAREIFRGALRSRCRRRRPATGR